jgi:hypothetical protein
MSVAAMSTAIRSIQTIRHGEGGVLAHEGGGRVKKSVFPSAQRGCGQEMLNGTIK